MLLLVGLAGTAFPATRAPASPRAFAPAYGGPVPPVPAASTAFYMQEGATLVQEDGVSQPTLPAITATFTLETSPWSTGYEVNGLSTTGDWFQGLATDNWPGCSSGLAFAYEVWNATGASVAGPVCKIPLVLSAGDQVQIGLTLNCLSGSSAEACFTFRDLTAGLADVVTVPQPDPTAAAFENLGSVANPNGYFTGPMTEVVDPSGAGCQAYGSMPAVGYVLEAGGVTVSQYIPWSDEFGVGGRTTSLCYLYMLPIQSVRSTSVSDYLEATGGSSYGPHWEAGQNWTAFSRQLGTWRFQTDVAPLTAAVTLSRTSADVGQNITITGIASGGAPPVACSWSVNGASVPQTACTWTQTAPAPGLETFTIFVVDNLSDVAEGVVTLSVSPDPSLPAPVDTPVAVDVGQSMTWIASVSGGSGGAVYTWSGLPAGCAGTTATIVCAPVIAGRYGVRVSITDWNGVTALSPSTYMTVSPEPALTLVASPANDAVGGAITFSADAQGGQAPFQYAWSGLPPGCTTSANVPSFSCTPTGAGSFDVRVQATDANGDAVTATAQVVVSQGIMGAPPAEGSAVTIAIAAAVILVVVAALVLANHHRGRNPPPPPPPATPPRSP